MMNTEHERDHWMHNIFYEIYFSFLLFSFLVVFDNCESFSSTLLFNWIRLIQPFRCHNMLLDLFSFRMVCGRRYCDRICCILVVTCNIHMHSTQSKENWTLNIKKRKNVSELTNNYIVGWLRCQWIFFQSNFRMFISPAL